MNTKTKIKIHDGIVGAMILGCVLLGLGFNTIWLYVAGAIGALMMSSTFTGFCPVYFILDRVAPTRGEA